MNVTLDFGTQGLPVTIDPANAAVLTTKVPPVLADPAARIAEVLEHPLGCSPFSLLAGNKQRACIVVSDKTRPVPNDLLLPPMLAVLNANKIETTILVACGMHSPTTGNDLVNILGREVAGRYKIINHDGSDESCLVNLGRSRQGVDVLINRHYHQADFNILTGFVEPHFMAGFSGGRKSVCPGIAGKETMKYFHGPYLLESPHARAGQLENNPVHAFCLEAAEMAGADFILNVTLDRSKRITGVFGGDLKKAHSEGCAFCRRHSSITVKRTADIVVTTGGGFPLDQDFYQTVKGMAGALDIIKQDGTIVIASQCSRGVGSENFKKLLLELDDYDKFIRMISQKDFFVIDQWEVEKLVHILKKVDVVLVSEGISADEAVRCHVGWAASVEQALDGARLKHGRGATVAVIPEGPFVMPEIG
jgi:nickel-dependent lactate racemase